MAGYNYARGMSNNAVTAYEDGGKPLSRWTKSDIIAGIRAQIREEGLTPVFNPSSLEQYRKKTLQDKFLTCTEWHHTGGTWYNKTNFYFIDSDAIENITPFDLVNADEANRLRATEKAEEKGRRARVSYLEWSGTRKHPKATECEATGTIKGNWFYFDDGNGKKSTSGRGFSVIEWL